MTSQIVPGTYVLVIELERDICIQVGSLGIRPFKKGIYLYVGSALGGLKARLARHLCQEKRIHWHIDSLLEQGQVREIWYHLSPKRHECTWARVLASLPGVCPFSAPFGASDCACKTHLFYSSQIPCLATFEAQFEDEPSFGVIAVPKRGALPNLDSLAGWKSEASSAEDRCRRSPEISPARED